MAASHFDRSPDMEYFQAIEKAFVALRGTPFQMSPDDWGVAGEWRRDGVPAELVAEVLAEVIGELEKKSSEVPLRLAYYRRAVAATWKQRRRLHAPADELALPDLDIDARLGALARALPAASWVDDSAEQIRALADLVPDVEAIEDALTTLDRSLLDRSSAALDPDDRLELDRQLDHSLRQLAGRLPGGASEAARRRLRDELVRRRVALPVLSLFSLEAADGASAPDATGEANPRDSP